MWLEAKSRSVGPGRGIGTLQRIITLRTFEPLAGLSTDEAATLAEYMRERFLPAGTEIVKGGRVVTGVHFVVQGSVDLRHAGRHVRTLGPQTVVGGLSAFTKRPDRYDAVTTEDTSTLEISVEDFTDILEDHFGLMRAVLGRTAEQILKTRALLGERAGFTDAKAGPQCRGGPLDLVERLAFLRRSMPLGRSQIEALVDLARESEEVRFGAGERIWSEGDAGGSVLLLVCGLADCQAGGGTQRWTLGAGDSLGGVDATAGLPRAFGAVAQTDLVALRVDVETLFDAFEDHFDMAMAFLRALSGALLTLTAARVEADAPDVRGVGREDIP